VSFVTAIGDAERPMRRDAVENRRRLLLAAAEVFAARGLDASVEEIAQSAGVGMGTLYRRFPTKEALIDQLVEDLFGAVVSAGREALTVTDGTGLETFIRTAAGQLEAQRGCMVRLWQGSIPPCFMAELDSVVSELLARAQAAGTVRADVVPTDLNVVFWALQGIIESTAGTAPDAWQRHLDLVFAGLRPGTADLVHPPITTEQRLAVHQA
jgi:AcrR family transcriptional regulator